MTDLRRRPPKEICRYWHDNLTAIRTMFDRHRKNHDAKLIELEKIKRQIVALEQETEVEFRIPSSHRPCSRSRGKRRGRGNLGSEIGQVFAEEFAREYHRENARSAKRAVIAERHRALRAIQHQVDRSTCAMNEARQSIRHNLIQLNSNKCDIHGFPKSSWVVIGY